MVKNTVQVYFNTSDPLRPGTDPDPRYQGVMQCETKDGIACQRSLINLGSIWSVVIRSSEWILNLQIINEHDLPKRLPLSGVIYIRINADSNMVMSRTPQSLPENMQAHIGIKC